MASERLNSIDFSPCTNPGAVAIPAKPYPARPLARAEGRRLGLPYRPRLRGSCALLERSDVPAARPRRRRAAPFPTPSNRSREDALGRRMVGGGRLSGLLLEYRSGIGYAGKLEKNPSYRQPAHSPLWTPQPPSPPASLVFRQYAPHLPTGRRSRAQSQRPMTLLRISRRPASKKSHPYSVRPTLSTLALHFCARIAYALTRPLSCRTRVAILGTANVEFVTV